MPSITPQSHPSFQNLTQEDVNRLQDSVEFLIRNDVLPKTTIEKLKELSPEQYQALIDEGVVPERSVEDLTLEEKAGLPIAQRDVGGLSPDERQILGYPMYDRFDKVPEAEARALIDRNVVSKTDPRNLTPGARQEVGFSPFTMEQAKAMLDLIE